MALEEGYEEQAAADAPAAGVPLSTIEFSLDPAAGVPTYLQLVQQVEQAVRLGSLEAGDQLPTVKEVVTALAINPNTVARAYRELENKGLTVGRPGQGTFIQPSSLSPVGLTQLSTLRRSLLAWLTTADAAGLDGDGIVALFTSALREFRAHPSDTHSRRGAPKGGSEGVA